MEVVKTVVGMREVANSLRGEGKKIGFVPTMGFLHEGHLSLVRAAREECDFVVVSIFVNPKQFDSVEDLENYPVDLERDLGLLEREGVDYCFVPSVEEMYPEGESFVEYKMPKLTNCLCGATRPGHFEGVMLVASKLLNIVRPNVIYLGQKDFQQCLVLKRLVGDLSIDVDVVVLPTFREKSGLAMSSRNSRLSEEGLYKASKVAQFLCSMEGVVSGGESSVSNLIDHLKNCLMTIDEFEIDYVDIRSAEDLSELNEVKGRVVVAVAVKVEGVRLIDNVIIST